MRGSARTATLAGLAAMALVATACSGGSGSGSGGSTDSGGSAITVFGCNPEHPLIPADTNEDCGQRVLDTSVSRLIHYNTETTKPEMDLAESIQTTDNQNFTVKLKPGRNFSDGTPIKAKNFVDAWNYAVANGLINESFFSPIAGYQDVAPGEDPDGDGPQTAPPGKSTTMTGLKVVDDTTFTIQTTEKVSNLVGRLGYSAFAPMPDSYFSDPKAFGEKPVGSGPYKVESWNKNQDITVVKDPQYQGAWPGKVDRITFRIFTNSDAAYNEVIANNLDAVDEIPTSALINEKYKQDLQGRAAQTDTGGIQTLFFPPEKADKSYQNPKLRQAISMAIDRVAVTDQIFSKARRPADGWVPPSIDGYQPNSCGEACTYNPTRAKQLLDEAGGYSGRFMIGYNADASHKDWVEAVCQSIKNALAVDCVGNPVPDFATLRSSINARKMAGMFRSGWIMDYPNIENFLAPQYATGASANDGDYSNKPFDAKLKEAAAAPNLEAANKLYQEAEKMLVADMPTIPLWYYKINYGWSDKVDNVKATAFNRLDYASITTK